MLRGREAVEDELVALLRAGRELSPASDRYLARSFLDELAAQRSGSRPTPSHRRRRFHRFGLAALLALAVAAPLSWREAHQSESISSTPLVCQMTRTYPSKVPEAVVAKSWHNLGWTAVVSRHGPDRYTVVFRRDHCVR